MRVRQDSESETGLEAPDCPEGRIKSVRSLDDNLTLSLSEGSFTLLYSVKMNESTIKAPACVNRVSIRCHGCDICFIIKDVKIRSLFVLFFFIFTHELRL